jgi:hypothetical protein
MRVRDLFKPGLTVPEHEVRDLHYIGEALPVPSQITTSISVEADASAGSSPITAREDHVHAVDIESLIQFINDNPTEIDLTNYYTKQEVDDLIDAIIVGDIGDIYYTKDEVDDFIDAIILVLDDLQDQIDVINAAILALPSYVISFEVFWSYGTVVAPAGTTTLGRYEVFREVDLVEFAVTLVLPSATDYVVKLWQADSPSFIFSVIDTCTITAGDTVQVNVLGSPINVPNGSRLLCTVDTEPAGDGEILTASARGQYV